MICFIIVGHQLTIPVGHIACFSIRWETLPNHSIIIARYWTYLTSLITSTPISIDIPDECEHFIKYGPDFTLPITPTYGIRDENTEEALRRIIRTLVHNISNHVTSPGRSGAYLREQHSNRALQIKQGVETSTQETSNEPQSKRTCLEDSLIEKTSNKNTKNMLP